MAVDFFFGNCKKNGGHFHLTENYRKHKKFRK